jgi:hypothetical protein
MSTNRFRYVGGSSNIRYRAVAATEYMTAALKAAFQIAAAPKDDPVKGLYATFHALRKVTEDLREKYRDQFPDWQHEGDDANGDTGQWRAQMDCLHFLEDRLRQKGIIKNPDDESGGGGMGYLMKIMALRLFSDAATSEFRFRHTLDYHASNYRDSPRSDLEVLAPAIKELLPELAAIDAESLRASKTAHAVKLAAAKQRTTFPQP